MLASAKTVRLAHEIDTDNRMGMMFAYLLSYANTCNPDDVLAELDFSRDIKDFYLDVHCRGYYPNYKLKEFERKGIRLVKEEGDDQALLALGVLIVMSVESHGTNNQALTILQIHMFVIDRLEFLNAGKFHFVHHPFIFNGEGYTVL